jgi:hypothetical protein
MGTMVSDLAKLGFIALFAYRNLLLIAPFALNIIGSAMLAVAFLAIFKGLSRPRPRSLRERLPSKSLVICCADEPSDAEPRPVHVCIGGRDLAVGLRGVSTAS